MSLEEPAQRKEDFATPCISDRSSGRNHADRGVYENPEDAILPQERSVLWRPNAPRFVACSEIDSLTEPGWQIRNPVKRDGLTENSIGAAVLIYRGCREA